MTKSKQLQSIVRRYREEHDGAPFIVRAVARWAIAEGLWAPQPEAIVSRCAEELGAALREEYYTDPQGRSVRTKHAAREHKGDKQQVLWDDIRTAQPAHMKMAFQQRREQILGDCRQLKADVDSFNENRRGVAIQMSFDFTLDLEEEAMTVS